MTPKKRREEVRRILALDTDELIRQSNGQLKVLDTLDEVYEFLAEEMVNEFEKAASGGKIVSFIMPVGPTQPYRIMAEKINYLNLNLKNVRFFTAAEKEGKCSLNSKAKPQSLPRQSLQHRLRFSCSLSLFSSCLLPDNGHKYPHFWV